MPRRPAIRRARSRTVGAAVAFTLAALALFSTEARAALPLDRWSYVKVDWRRKAQSFGLAFGDLTGDGRADVVAGSVLYRNPGGDLAAPWPRVELPPGDVMTVLDVSGDGRADIVALRCRDLSWLEAKDAAGTRWRSHDAGTHPHACDHDLSTQGYATAQIVPGGLPELVLSGSADDPAGGVVYFVIPPGGRGPWKRVSITAEVTEAVALGDIDGDGDLDLVAGGTGDKAVAWYANPGNGSAGWAEHQIGVPGGWTDRIAVGDFDRDGALDVVTAEENGAADGARTVVFRQIPGTKSLRWTRVEIARQGSTNNLDVGDLDRDGDLDIVTAEHKGALRVTIHVNDGRGRFAAREIARGIESHLGARLFDLDGDGDLDLVSTAWDRFADLHLWRNDAIRRAADRVPAQVEPEPPRRGRQVAGLASGSLLVLAATTAFVRSRRRRAK